MSNRNKAVFRGTCQVCSRTQKLPNGVLAKHGYQVLGGFFEGTCFGSGHLPLEQDKTLVEESIRWAGQRWLETKQMAIIWSVPATEPKVWFHVYVESDRRRAHYQWQRCDVRTIEQRGIKYVEIFMEGKWRSGLTYSLHGDLMELANKSHEEYIRRYLQPKMRELNRYCKDQQWRIDVWHKQPLKLVEVK